MQEKVSPISHFQKSRNQCGDPAGPTSHLIFTPIFHDSTSHSELHGVIHTVSGCRRWVGNLRRRCSAVLSPRTVSASQRQEIRAITAFIFRSNTGEFKDILSSIFPPRGHLQTRHRANGSIVQHIPRWHYRQPFDCFRIVYGTRSWSRQLKQGFDGYVHLASDVEA
jgi:hypothetical protein